MKNFKEFITERFVNLHADDHEEKMKHASEVHGMLQKAYASQGGLKGKEFDTPESMVKHIPLWKMHKKDGKIHAVALYKDKSGRKRVAIGTDRSPEGKKGITNIIKNDVSQKRSYSEISGKSLEFHKAHMNVKEVALHKDEARKILNDNGDEHREVPHDDVELLKHPELKDHMYQRKIKNEWHTKIMIGSAGNKIT